MFTLSSTSILCVIELSDSDISMMLILLAVASGAAIAANCIAALLSIFEVEDANN